MSEEATTDMTQMSRAFDPKTIFQNSAALPIVKIRNVKSHMGEDVFRIFRKTMNDVREISIQHEKQQSHYLKSCYLEKNQLQKELARISLLRENPSMQRKKMEQNLGNIYREEIRKSQEITKTSLGGQTVKDSRNFAQKRSEHVLSPSAAVKYEKSKMLVNRSKKCECCKSITIRIKEHCKSKIEKEERRKPEQEELEMTVRPLTIESEEIKAPDTSKCIERKAIRGGNEVQTEREVSLSAINSNNSKAAIEDASTDTEPDLANRKTHFSFPVIKEEGKFEVQEINLRPTKDAVNIDEELVQTSSFRRTEQKLPGDVTSPVLRSQTCPAIMAHPHSPQATNLLRRSKVAVRLPLATNTKVKLEGQAWKEHLLKLQNLRPRSTSNKERNEFRQSVTVTKAYLRFRRALYENRRYQC